MNLKKYNDLGDIRRDWGISDVIIINYESLGSWKLNILNELIDEKTMIVFDEVHRIKNPEGTRAGFALSIGEKANYIYVLTGTPIPNSYKDIYVFLHLLYKNEYNTFFGWNVNELEINKANEINQKIQPFFWRTNKNDLNVPPADQDELLKYDPMSKQRDILETIYEVETNVLSKYIRLLQASTNPELLIEKISVEDLGLLNDEKDSININSALNDDEVDIVKKTAYLNLNLQNIETPKFIEGIKLIQRLVSEGKKVIVWGMFVGTMQKIFNKLESVGISAILIYGKTPKDNRVNLINEFRNGSIQVLISNPATLGESISLHQTVHDAIYFEYNFNLTFMLQSRDRIHRLGLQSDQYTHYYYLMSKGDAQHQGFIDEQVYKRLKEKEDIMSKAIDGEFLSPEISTSYLDDIKDILSD